MTETFFGPWLVMVVSKDASFDEQFTITGSDASDGVYSGVPGTELQGVSGQGWTLTMEWNDNQGSGWQSSGVRRSASYTVQDGLVIVLGADDNYEDRRDGDFNDMVLICRSLDPEHHPLHPITNPYDFTHPEDRGDPDRQVGSSDAVSLPGRPTTRADPQRPQGPMPY